MKGRKMTANFRGNVTAIWRRNVWWPSSRLVSFCPSGWKKETGHASRGHEGCCKTLRLNILDAFRPATPFHPSAHPFLVGDVEGTTPHCGSTSLRREILFFSFLFFSSCLLSPLRALMSPLSLSLSFEDPFFLPLCFSRGTLEQCPGGNPRLSPVCLFSGWIRPPLFIDNGPLRRRRGAERLPRLSLGQFFGGWLRSWVMISRCLDELPPLWYFFLFLFLLWRSSFPLQRIPIYSYDLYRYVLLRDIFFFISFNLKWWRLNLIKSRNCNFFFRIRTSFVRKFHNTSITSNNE